MTKYNYSLPEHNYNSEKFDIEYPEVEDIEFSYTEHGNPKKYRPNGTMTKRALDRGMYISCGDPICNSKYNIYELIKSMIIENRTEINNHIIFCGSRRFSPKGQKEYSPCGKSIKLNIKLIYKR